MTQAHSGDIKKNVSKFDEDVSKTGSYAYTTDRLSARIANKRMSDSIAQAFHFPGKRVLDLGCGDGTYTLEYASLGVQEVVGIDPASVAVEAARAKARKLGVDSIVRFEVGNIYALDELIANDRFDCIVLRGVLHHLPDPERAILGLGKFRGTIIILEPNGLNPVLKLLEKYSRYHVEHEERSFSAGLIRQWIAKAGLKTQSTRVFNLVPMFSPDWMAKICNILTPVMERMPLIRQIACGSNIFVAHG